MEQCVLSQRLVGLVYESMDTDLGFSYGWHGNIAESYHIKGNLHVAVVSYQEIIEYDDWCGEKKHHWQPQRCVVLLVNHRESVQLIDCPRGNLLEISMSRSGKSLTISYRVFDSKKGMAENKRVLFDLKTGLPR